MISDYGLILGDIFRLASSLLDKAAEHSGGNGLSTQLSNAVGYEWAIWIALINVAAIILNMVFVWNRNGKVKTETKHLRAQTKALSEQLKNTDRAFIEQVNCIRRTEISKQLQEFLAPLKSLRTQSYKLYQVFAIDEKAQCKLARDNLKNVYESRGESFERSLLNQDEVNECYFGTVRFFVKGHKFGEKDLQVFDQILKVSERIVELVSEKSYLPRNPALTEILGEYLAHIEATKMARKGRLTGVYKLADLSMPLELDGAIESEIMRLEKEYQSLLPIHTSQIIKQRPKNSSIAYYDKNAAEYHNKTNYIDMTDAYDMFREKLPRETQLFILDAGCGSGRDTRYFIKSGFRVKSFDASEEMVNYCNMYPFAFCEQRTFSDVTEVEMFHGVWACASLLHLDTDDFNDALSKLVYALKPLGVLYFSIKASAEEESYHEDGRSFYYHKPDKVEKLLIELGMEEISIWENKGKKKGNPSKFVNFLCRKPRLITSPDSRARTS